MPSLKDQPTFFSNSVRNSRRFYLDLAPPQETSLTIVCGGYEECSKDYAIRRQSFPYYSLELVVKGHGNVILNGTQHDLSPGSVFTYGPGIVHEINTHRRSRLYKYFVDFTGVDTLAIFNQLGSPAGNYMHLASTPEVQLLFNELIRDGIRGDANSPELCLAMFRCIVLRTAAYSADIREDSPEPYDTYQRCLEYITENAERLVSQQQAANECNVSPAYLSRLFKRHGRQRPYQYLTRLRMNLAAERLLETTDTVKQIAEGLGYTDPFHFSRTFKATLGVSPSEFRSLR